MQRRTRRRTLKLSLGQWTARARRSRLGSSRGRHSRPAGRRDHAGTDTAAPGASRSSSRRQHRDGWRNAASAGVSWHPTPQYLRECTRRSRQRELSRAALAEVAAGDPLGEAGGRFPMREAGPAAALTVRHTRSATCGGPSTPVQRGRRAGRRPTRRLSEVADRAGIESVEHGTAWTGRTWPCWPPRDGAWSRRCAPSSPGALPTPERMASHRRETGAD